MIDLLDKRVVDEVIENFLGVLRVTLQAQRKSFGALQEQECGKRRDRRAGISEQDCADIHRECSLTCGVCKLHAVIAGVWLGNPRISARSCPIKGAAVYDDAAECRAVTADEFCRRVNDDVCAVLDRSDKIRSAEGVVNNERKSVSVGDLGERVDVGDIAVRVAEGLDVDRLGVGLDSRRDLLEVVNVNEGGVNAVKR